MPMYLCIPLVVGTTLVGLLVILQLVIRFFHSRLERAVLEHFSAADIVRKHMWANYFGRSKKGLAQMRGNGALVLTNSRLWFMLAAPRTEIDIPLERITHVGTVRSHLGKTRFMPLLFVEFDTPKGHDSIAWAVRDTEGWVKSVEMSWKNAQKTQDAAD